MITLSAVSVLALLVAPPSFGRDAVGPRLGVVVVVDQMRADYLERDPAFNGGFRRLASEGAVFTAARHLHVPTETCPGHAAISTGRAPITHGIVANEWFDRAKGAQVYCVADDPYGTGPGNFSGPTLADAVKASDPKARVFSVSGKDRAAVLLGGRHPDLALWLDRARGVFTTSSYYRRPDWLDAFNTELMKSGLLPLTGGKVADEALAGPAFDEATARLVSELVRREQVGRGPSTDLLLVSFSATDYVGHRYGTEAPQMVSQLRAVDSILGRLLSQLEAASGGSLKVAFSADHGAIASPEDPSGKRLGVRRTSWNVLGAALEAALQARWPAPAERWILAGSMPHIYLNRALAARQGLDWPLFLREAAKVLRTVDGIDRAFATMDVPALDDADPLNAVLRRSVRADRAGDLYVFLRENLLLHGSSTGTSHGSLWDYDARVPLVFWGTGIRAARFDGPASPLDIAPTLARLLGVRYEPGDGGALRNEVLTAPKSAEKSPINQ